MRPTVLMQLCAASMLCSIVLGMCVLAGVVIWLLMSGRCAGMVLQLRMCVILLTRLLLTVRLKCCDGGIMS